MEFNKNFAPPPPSGAQAVEPKTLSQAPPPATGPTQALKSAACDMLGDLSTHDPFATTKAASVNTTGLILTPESAYRDTLKNSLRSEATESVRNEITKKEGPLIKSELREELTADFMKQNGF